MRARGREALRALIAVHLCLLQSCATLEVPPKAPIFQPSEFSSASSDGIEIRAKAIRGVDSYLELFDDNLPEIGIAAIWVVVRNSQAQEIDLVKARWDLRLDGIRRSVLGLNQLFDLYYKRRGIRLYSQYVDAKGRSDLAKLALHLGRVQGGQERAGFMFFGITPVLTADWIHAAVLGLHNVRLSNGRKIAIEVALSYANP